MLRAAKITFGCLLIAIAFAPATFANPAQWKFEWPKTDFTKNTLDYGEILSGGQPKDCFGFNFASSIFCSVTITHTLG